MVYFKVKINRDSFTFSPQPIYLFRMVKKKLIRTNIKNLNDDTTIMVSPLFY